MIPRGRVAVDRACSRRRRTSECGRVGTAGWFRQGHAVADRAGPALGRSERAGTAGSAPPSGSARARCRRPSRSCSRWPGQAGAATPGRPVRAGPAYPGGLPLSACHPAGGIPPSSSRTPHRSCSPWPRPVGGHADPPSAASAGNRAGHRQADATRQIGVPWARPPWTAPPIPLTVAEASRSRHAGPPAAGNAGNRAGATRQKGVPWAHPMHRPTDPTHRDPDQREQPRQRGQRQRTRAGATPAGGLRWARRGRSRVGAVVRVVSRGSCRWGFRTPDPPAAAAPAAGPGPSPRGSRPSRDVRPGRPGTGGRVPRPCRRAGPAPRA